MTATGHPERLTHRSDERIFRDAYPRLRRFAASWSSLGSDPDDLVQEAVARALRRGPLSGLDDPVAYLRRSISNIAKNEFRARTDRPDTGAQRITWDRYPSELCLLESLDPTERVALLLVDVEGLSYSEAARQCACSAGAIRMRLYCGRRNYRRLTAESYSSEE